MNLTLAIKKELDRVEQARKSSLTDNSANYNRGKIEAYTLVLQLIKQWVG